MQDYIINSMGVLRIRLGLLYRGFFKGFYRVSRGVVYMAFRIRIRFRDIVSAVSLSLSKPKE